MNRVLLGGAQVITLAPNRPDAERADILIEADTIAAVGGGLDETGAEIIEVPGRIIMPGLVNAQPAHRLRAWRWQ